MADNVIPPFRYSFTSDDAAWIAAEIGELFASGSHLTMGRHGDQLEAEFAHRSGVGHVVAVSNGTSALEIILRCLGVDGGEVLVPTNTFGASLVPIMRVGATPVLVDIADDLSASPADVARRLGPSTSAVMVVHIGGLVSPHVEEIADLCRAAGVPLIEDAAHAAGARLGGKHPGSFGAAAAFSLFSTKVITAGEGGLIATDDEQLATAARHLRDHAKEPDGTMNHVGYNWRLTEMQAVVARCQLARLDEIIAERGRAAKLYDGGIVAIPGLTPLPVAERCEPNWYKYVVFVDGADPDRLTTDLARDDGVHLGGRVYQVPCHRQPAFARLADDEYPVADRLCPSHICLPIYTGITEGETDQVLQALQSAMAAAHE